MDAGRVPGLEAGTDAPTLTQRVLPHGDAAEKKASEPPASLFAHEAERLGGHLAEHDVVGVTRDPVRAERHDDVGPLVAQEVRERKPGAAA
jgi:hypothetical protein